MVSQYRESSASYSAPAFGSSRTTVRQREHARLHTPALSVIAVWRDALASFNTHSAAILLCASIGIAAPVIVTKAIDTLAKLSAYARAESAVAIAAIYDAPALSTVLAGAITGLLGLTLARGIITWIALQGSVHGLPPCKAGKTRGSFGEAICVTIANFPALLVGTLVYGLLLTASIIGMIEVSQHLEYKRDRALHNWDGLPSAASDGLSQLAWRGFNALIPNPGPPFVELMPSLRHAAVVAPTAARVKTVRVEDAISAYSSSHTYEPTQFNVSSRAVQPSWITSSASQALALGSVALMLLAETLLRFRTIMVLIPSRDSMPRRVGLLTPLMISARFGLQHFCTYHDPRLGGAAGHPGPDPRTCRVPASNHGSPGRAKRPALPDSPRDRAHPGFPDDERCGAGERNPDRIQRRV